MSTSVRSWRTAFLTAAALAGVTAPLVATPAQAAPARTRAAATLEVLATGLVNARDVTALRDGRVLVAEAGDGKADCAADAHCVGQSGAVYQVRGTQKGRVLTGLASAGKGSTATGGAQEVSGPTSVEPAAGGGYVVLSGLGGTAETRAALGPAASTLGTLYRTRDGKILADLADIETRLNPDGGDVHANPWRFIKNGSGYLTTDAGGNTLIASNCVGTTSTRFVFPKNETSTGLAEAVPTGIVRGGDGTVYISDMSGVRKDASRIWKIAPGGQPEVVVTGLTNLVDIALDGKGNLYALSFTDGFQQGPPKDGRLSKINLSTKAITDVPTTEPLNQPTGLDIGPQGQIYVVAGNSINSKLLRVRP
ncbi:ScyD/ScyE family protein [Streptomyces sp. NPDC051183]|uniref:ScyD/ScyE family protein n=1 Tax=Streptomyces sp. NPDC051183 TaxID=3155165 RepID=UPI0034247B65